MTIPHVYAARQALVTLAVLAACAASARGEVGVGAGPIEGAEVLFDGTREMLDAKWTYWNGPRFSSSLPIKWKIVRRSGRRGHGRDDRRSGCGGRQVRHGGRRDQEEVPGLSGCTSNSLSSRKVGIAACTCRIAMKSRCWMGTRRRTEWVP